MRDGIARRTFGVATERRTMMSVLLLGDGWEDP